MPSIGIVFSNLSSDKKHTFMGLIQYILEDENNIKGKELYDRIPLLGIDIKKTIIEILYKGFSNNSNEDNILKRKIEEISIDTDDIFSIKTDNKKLNKKKIKTEYIIPYKYDSTKKKITLILKNEYGQKSISEVLELNYKIIKHVLENLDENIDKENYKNVLVCFLFFIIQLVYDINKQYLTKLNNVIMEISDISGLNFIDMDIESTLEYISSLSKSLYKIKLILLNNFNTFLKPSKSFDNNYGMKKNENGYFVPESVFLESSKNIIDNYPFMFNNNSIIIRESQLQKFILNFKKNTDIYDPDTTLYFGCEIRYDITDTKKSLDKYLHKIKVYNIICEFIIETLRKIFLENKCFPIELIDSYIFDNERKFKSVLSPNTQFKDKIFSLFATNYSNSIKFLEELVRTKNNIGHKKEVLQLCSRLYMFSALSVMYITENSLNSVELKNELIKLIHNEKKSKDRKIKILSNNNG